MAAGSSSRMGEPKQLLPWKNTFLLNHVIDMALDLRPTSTFVVLGANFDSIKSRIQNRAVTIIHNKNWDVGLGTSIASGIKLIKAQDVFDAALIILADQPLIDHNFLLKFITGYNNDDRQIIASSYENGSFGVPALFDKYYFDELIDLSQDKGAKNIMVKHESFIELINSNHLISDIDTMDDYEELYRANHQ